MLSVAEAEKIILLHLFKPLKQTIAIQSSPGKILAEEIKADRDFPPFNRAAMDGIAILFKSFENGNRNFFIEAMQAAGQEQKALIDKNACIEIMTGAVLPEGTDTIIPYENIKVENQGASILNEPVLKAQNIHGRGSDAKQNEVLLSAGMKISAAEVALLASVGKVEVAVFKNPKAAIISTGDELVDVHQTPLPHQIRKSNSYALMAALNNLGCEADAFHLKDDEVELTKSLNEILGKYELIILSGGVSKGKLDLVPKVLESLGVKKSFHGVSQRPGKPMWFGASDKNFVFALPGNPVSTFMCFHRYVKPWLEKSIGFKSRNQSAILAKDFSFQPSLTYFLQVKIENEEGKLMAYPIVGGGSGDFANLKEVDGFLELALDRVNFMKGEAMRLISFR
jgi:molybdopterin molybdotransferase